MNYKNLKQISIEDILNLKSHKLFEDLGYNTKVSATEQITRIEYSNYHNDKIREIIISVADRVIIEIDPVQRIIRPQYDINISELIYPIIKLMEELEVNIEQMYFNYLNATGDNDE